jgi:hypothetical protein
MELGKVLCTRAELERRTGDGTAAWATLIEIETIAAQTVGRPDPELGRRVASLRQALSGS